MSDQYKSKQFTGIELLQWAASHITEYQHQQLTLDADLANQHIHLDIRSPSPRSAIQEAHSKSIPAIGQFWSEQGGYLAGIMPGKNCPDYYLIVTAPECEFSSSFGSYGETINTCESDGYDNTQLMISTSADYPAAKKCAALIIDGHRDFYLWSRREARLAAATCPDLFDKDPWYLTSSQYSADGAYVQDFQNGIQNFYYKNCEFRVRPVRRLFIHSFNNF